MFVIENYFDTRRAKIVAWETARQEFADKADYSSQIDAWERSHPNPVVNWKRVFGIAIPVLIGAVVFAAFVMMIVDQSSKPKKPEDPKAPAIVHNCQDFNKDDYVRIQVGDYAGATGTVVGGCSPNQSYQVRLENQKVELYEDSKTQLVEVGGRVIPVGTDNLVGIDKPKVEEKK